MNKGEAMVGRLRRLGLMMLGCLIASACTRAEDPVAQCGSPSNQQKFVDLIFAQSRAQPGQPVGVTTGPLKAMPAYIDELAHSPLLKIELVTLSKFDPNTGNIECEAKLGFRPTGKFASPEVLAGAEVLATDLNLPPSKQSIPADVFFDVKGTQKTVHFKVVKNASTGQTIIQTEDDADSTAAAIRFLAYARALVALAPSDGNPQATPSIEPDKVADEGHFPKIGKCYDTNVKAVTARLVSSENGRDVPVPDSGSAVEYADGHYMVDYSASAEVNGWRNGDPIKLCVTSLPENCPPGDLRGVGYRATNRRTQGAWEAGDSEHLCGGA